MNIIINTYKINDYLEELITFKDYLPSIFLYYIPVNERINFLYENKLNKVLDNMSEVRDILLKSDNPHEFMKNELMSFYLENQDMFEDLFFVNWEV